METHVHGFGPFWLDFVGDDAQSGGIVGFRWGWGGFMAHLLELMSLRDFLTEVDVERSEFCFRRG